MAHYSAVRTVAGTFRIAVVLCSIPLVQGQSRSVGLVRDQVVLDTDARLARKVSLDETGVSLADLCEKLSDSHIKLACSPRTADQKLQIRLKDRPLADLLAAIAKLIPGSWRATTHPDGYRFDMDPEAVASRKKWWDLYLAERQRALYEQALASLRAMRGAPDPRTEFSDEVVRAAAHAPFSFFGSLPAPLQERIASRIIDARYYKVRLTDLTSQDVSEGATFVSLRDLPASAQQTLRSRLANQRHLSGPGSIPGSTIVQFSNFGAFIRVFARMPDGYRSSTDLALSVGDRPESPALWPDHAYLAEAVKDLGGKAPPAWRRLAAYQERRFWAANKPAVIKGTRPLPTRRADVLRWLAAKRGIEFVADYYSQASILMTIEDYQREPVSSVEAELNLQSAYSDFSWMREKSGIYLARNNRWYRDDLLEVPPKLSAELLEAGRDRGRSDPPSSVQGRKEWSVEATRIQLDWQAAMATQLSPWQVANGLAWLALEEAASPAGVGTAARRVSYPYYQDADRLLREYDTSRFYGQLSFSQRALIVAGELPAARLSPTQLRVAAALLPEMAIVLQDTSASRLRLGLESRLPGGLLMRTVSPYQPAPILKPETRLVIQAPSGQN